MVASMLGDEVFCINIRGTQAGYSQVLNMLEGVFRNGEYHEVLDVIEFVASNFTYVEDFFEPNVYVDLFKEYNRLFEQEYVGYRFINDKIVRITNKDEIQSINEAMRSPYDAVNEHLCKAVSYISESGNQDFANSIKESVTALETLCSILTGNSSATLGKTIKSMSGSIHPLLIEAVLKLYGFASDEPGIRHGSAKTSTVFGFDESKMILVICSAITNYLISIYRPDLHVE